MYDKEGVNCKSYFFSETLLSFLSGCFLSGTSPVILVQTFVFLGYQFQLVFYLKISYFTS